MSDNINKSSNTVDATSTVGTADAKITNESAAKSSSRSAKPLKPPKIFNAKKRKTYLRMLRSIVIATLGIIAVLIVLQLFGVNVSSMLAGVGIVSIVVGFALQDALKDIIRGIEIVANDYYDIGDVIKFGDNLGQVLSINLHTTKIQDINSMNIVSIANRNIDKVELDTGYIYISVPLPYELKIKDAEAAMNDIVSQVSKDSLVKTCAYQGLTDIASSSLNYQIVITCDPINRLQTRRDALGLIVATLEKRGISIPYEQLDVHKK